MNSLLVVIGLIAFICNIAVIINLWNITEKDLFLLEQKALILNIDFPINKNNHRFGVPTHKEYVILYQIDYKLAKKLRKKIFINRLLSAIFSITFLLTTSIWYNLNLKK